MRIVLVCLFLLVIFAPACGSSVDINPHGQFACKVDDDCDDDNPCTDDTCGGKLCKFVWVQDGTKCTDDSGASGVCSSGVCGD